MSVSPLYHLYVTACTCEQRQYDHAAITVLLDQGAALRETQRFSRHADPLTLMQYDDNRTDIAGEMARTVSELV